MHRSVLLDYVGAIESPCARERLQRRCTVRWKVVQDGTAVCPQQAFRGDRQFGLGVRERKWSVWSVVYWVASMTTVQYALHNRIAALPKMPEDSMTTALAQHLINYSRVGNAYDTTTRCPCTNKSTLQSFYALTYQPYPCCKWWGVVNEATSLLSQPTGYTWCGVLPSITVPCAVSNSMLQLLTIQLFFFLNDVPGQVWIMAP